MKQVKPNVQMLIDNNTVPCINLLVKFICIGWIYVVA